MRNTRAAGHLFQQSVGNPRDTTNDRCDANCKVYKVQMGEDVVGVVKACYNVQERNEQFTVQKEGWAIDVIKVPRNT